MQAEAFASVSRNGAPGWEAVALRLFRCNLFGEQGVVFAPSFVLVLGSEMCFGRLPLLVVRSGGAGRRGATRLVHAKHIPARDRVRGNLVDFQSCSPFPSVRANPPDSGGYEPSSLKRTCTGATACDSTIS